MWKWGRDNTTSMFLGTFKDTCEGKFKIMKISGWGAGSRMRNWARKGRWELEGKPHKEVWFPPCRHIHTWVLRDRFFKFYFRASIPIHVLLNNLRNTEESWLKLQRVVRKRGGIKSDLVATIVELRHQLWVKGREDRGKSQNWPSWFGYSGLEERLDWEVVGNRYDKRLWKCLHWGIYQISRYKPK